jgi:hypothetical protein
MLSNALLLSDPRTAICALALLVKELPCFLEDVQIAREAYEKLIALNRRYLH